MLTVSIMGSCTFLIGLLPTFDRLGTWAAVLLVGLRIVQGLGIGGEFGAGALVALENAPRGRRGLMGSLHQVGTPAGLLASTGVFALMQLLPDDAFAAYGWRIPFLLSGGFLAVAFYIRKNLPETRAFQVDRQETRKFPLLALLREHPKNIALATGARMADAVTFNVINVFGIAYATKHLGLPNEVMLTGFTIAAAVEIAAIPVIGTISDRVGRRPVYLTGIVICGIFGIAYFPLLATGSTILAWLAIVVMLAFGTGCMFAIQGTLFAELFGTKVRYTGVGVAYQASALLGGAPTPIIATALAAWAGNSYWPVVGYLAALCLLSLVCIVVAGETYKNNLTTEAKAGAAKESRAG